MNKNGTEQNKTEIVQPPIGGYLIPYAHSPQEDEIRLIDYLRVLVKRKSIIIISGLTAIATIGAVLYALSLTPVYKAEAVFLPPTASDIQPLIIQGVQGIDIDSVYASFNRYLHERAPRHTVFEKMNLLSRFAPEGDQDADSDVIFDGFNRSLTVTTPNTKKGDASIPTVTLSMEGEDPVLIAEIVNRFAEEAERTTTAEIISDIQARVSARTRDLNHEIQLLCEKTKKQRLDEIERLETADALERKTITDKMSSLRMKARSERLAEIARLEETDRIEREKIEDKMSSLRMKARSERLAEISRLEEADRIAREEIEDKIGTLRNTAKEKRLDRLAELKESAGIAHSLGIKDLLGYRLNRINSSTFSKSQIITDIFNANPHPYTRGYEALEAEISSLSDRTSDDSFIPELRGLQDSLKQLENNERIAALKARENDDPFIPELRGLQEKLKLLEHNENIAALKARENDDPFIPELRGLQEKLKLLEHNENIAALKARENDDPFIPELRGLQEKLTLLEYNRKVEQLKSRQNDDPFIPSLRDKESELARLESIQIDPLTVTTARLDQAAYTPKQRIKPNRRRIVMLGFVLGLTLGIFGAFFGNALENARKEEEELPDDNRHA